MHAGVEASDGDLGSGFHGAKTGDNHLVVNFRAVIAAVFGYFKEVKLERQIPRSQSRGVQAGPEQVIGQEVGLRQGVPFISDLRTSDLVPFDPIVQALGPK
jgi:hypothetical protein